MTRIELSPQGIAPSETSTSQDETSLTGFEELAMPLLDSLFNYARWLTRNQNDAEDIVQEAYLRAFRGFKSFRPGTNFRAWMYRILHNTFLSSRAGLGADSTFPLDSEDDASELAAEHETPETILMRRSSSRLILSAIDELPVHYRETLLLCDVEGTSYRECAKILSIPIGTVMSRLARARKEIRESLGNTPTYQLRHPSARPEAHEKSSSLRDSVAAFATF